MIIIIRAEPLGGRQLRQVYITGMGTGNGATGHNLQVQPGNVPGITQILHGGPLGCPCRRWRRALRYDSCSELLFFAINKNMKITEIGNGENQEENKRQGPY